MQKHTLYLKILLFAAVIFILPHSAIARPSVATPTPTSKPTSKAAPKNTNHPIVGLIPSDTFMAAMAPSVEVILQHVKKRMLQTGQPQLWLSFEKEISREFSRKLRLRTKPKNLKELAKAIGIHHQTPIAFSISKKMNNRDLPVAIFLRYTDAKRVHKFIVTSGLGRDLAREQWYRCERRMTHYANLLKAKGQKGPYTLKLIEKHFPQSALTAQCPYSRYCEAYNYTYRYSKRSYLRTRCERNGKKYSWTSRLFYDIWKDFQKSPWPTRLIKNGSVVGGIDQYFAYALLHGKYLVLSNNTNYLQEVVQAHQSGSSVVSKRFPKVTSKTHILAYFNHKILAKIIQKEQSKLAKRIATGKARYYVKRQHKELQQIQLLNDLFSYTVGTISSTADSYKVKVQANPNGKSVFFTQKPGTKHLKLFKYVPQDAWLAASQNVTDPVIQTILKFIKLEGAKPKAMKLLNQGASLLGTQMSLFLLPSPRRSICIGGALVLKDVKKAQAFLNQIQTLARKKFKVSDYKGAKIHSLIQGYYRKSEFSYTITGKQMLFGFHVGMPLNYVMKRMLDAKGNKQLSLKPGKLIPPKNSKALNLSAGLSVFGLRDFLVANGAMRYSGRQQIALYRLLGLFKHFRLQWSNNKGKLQLQLTGNTRYKISNKP